MKKFVALMLLLPHFCFSQGVDMAEKIVSDSELELDSSFYVTEISDSLFEKMQGKSFKADCTIPRENLRHLHLIHKNREGKTVQGELVCNEKIADILVQIFKELYVAGYPIEKIRLVDEYDADDERSMSDNNSSCFNFRFISHTTTVSMHGQGLAVDINPLYNPYYKRVKGKPNVEPANGEPYLDRSKKFPYKIDHNDLAYKLFTNAGFEWGGDWKNVKDYQHFEWLGK
ncbi:MAG: M15 family metallopeptidase [Treponema sp.]|nr:M15 family metallopeptidase [Treponema sp.]